jgi:hypothetical protein
LRSAIIAAALSSYFALPTPGGGLGGKHGATQAATQPFEFVDLREQRRDAGDANQDRGLSSLPIHPTGTPVDGTRIAVP